MGAATAELITKGLRNTEDRGMGDLSSNYERLMAKSRDSIVLQTVEGLVEWDMQTKMPPRGIGLRSQQLSLLGQMVHRMLTDPEVGSLLEAVLADPDFLSLSEVQRRNVYLIKKAYDEEKKLPEELVAETARQRAIALDVWKKAKASKDFSIFKPELEKLFDLRRRAAEILMEVKGTPTPYDALLDIFEPKMAAHQISPVFERLRSGLMRLVEACGRSQPQSDDSFLRRRVPVEAQRLIAKSIADFIGYQTGSPDAAGRIDETEHPFTVGYYDDVRITTHYYEENLASSIFSVLHEGGHAMYELSLPREWMYQPVGAACSYGFHESQSRFIENVVGRSREFWAYYLPQLKGLVGQTLSDVELDSFVAAVNRVQPSKIRVEADEVTYCLHVIIRFEIERDLFAGRVSISELPEVWNQKYSDYLGVKVEDDAEGLMQDTHWASGYFGYFPSYALGNIYSGQILRAMEREMPDWRADVERGDLRRVRGWLHDHVHAYGNLYDPPVLLEKATGEKPSAEPYMDYLWGKYSKIYGF